MDDYLLGSAAVSITDFECDVIRNLDQKNVERLRNVFDKHGCIRDNPEFFIPVLINRDTLHAALERAGASGHVLDGKGQPPTLQLPLGITLRALRGRHRILAARKHLDASDQWWPVRLYESSLPEELQNKLREARNNEQGFRDGDKFRRWRQNPGRRVGEAWLADMSRVRERYCRRLSRSYDGELCRVFDELVPFAGLWSDFCAGTLGRILDVKCGEELISHAKCILRTWRFILGDEVQPGLLDPGTVSKLAHRYPSLSRNDAREIQRWMTEREIFPNVRSLDARQVILDRILQCERIVTIHSWTDDAFLLRAGYKAIESLFEFKSKSIDSLFNTLKRHYAGKASFPQVYLQTWLVTLRFHPELSNDMWAFLGKASGPKPPLNKQRQAQFAVYLRGLGYTSSELDRKVLQRETDQLDPIELEPEMPELVSNVTDVLCKARSGRPTKRSFECDRRSLHLQYVCKTDPCPMKEYITTFAVIKHIIHCYWGDLISKEAGSRNLNLPYDSPSFEGSVSQNYGDEKKSHDTPSMSLVDDRAQSECHRNGPLALGEDYRALLTREFVPSSIYSRPEVVVDLTTVGVEEARAGSATFNDSDSRTPDQQVARYTTTSGFPGESYLTIPRFRNFQLSAEDINMWTRTNRGNLTATQGPGFSDKQTQALIPYDRRRAISERPESEVAAWPRSSAVGAPTLETMWTDAERPSPAECKALVSELERIWPGLDHTKFYVLSQFDVIGLKKRQLQGGTYPQDLGYIFYYDKKERALFEKEMRTETANGFSLLLVKSPNAAEPGKCYDGTLDECRRMVFEDPLMWFAILPLGDETQNGAQGARPRSTARKSSVDTVMPRSLKRKRATEQWYRVPPPPMPQPRESSTIAPAVGHEYEGTHPHADASNGKAMVVHRDHRQSGFPDQAEVEQLGRSARLLASEDPPPALGQTDTVPLQEERSDSDWHRRSRPPTPYSKARKRKNSDTDHQIRIRTPRRD